MKTLLSILQKCEDCPIVASLFYSSHFSLLYLNMATGKKLPVAPVLQAPFQHFAILDFFLIPLSTADISHMANLYIFQGECGGWSFSQCPSPRSTTNGWEFFVLGEEKNWISLRKRTTTSTWKYFSYISSQYRGIVQKLHSIQTYICTAFTLLLVDCWLFFASQSAFVCTKTRLNSLQNFSNVGTRGTFRYNWMRILEPM